MFSVQFLQAHEDKFRADEAKWHKKLARLKDDVSCLQMSDANEKEKIWRLELENAGLKEQLHLWPKKMEVKDIEGENLWQHPLWETLC